ncbi:MAG TPA: helix-turn-helix domain-containing protein [Acidimicrobiia bacterium]
MAGERGTRELLITVAERLFAERGIEAVSLREIGAAAGQRNNSAAQYHFGSRDGLVDAIFDTRMAPIDEQRRAMVADLGAEGATSDLRALCEAFVVPLAAAAEAQPGPSWYARFLAQVVFDPGFELLARRRLPVTTGLRQVLGLLDGHLDHVPRPLRAERLQLAATLVVHGLAQRERVQQAARDADTTAPAVFVADLVDAMVGVLSAPVSPATTRELRATSRRTA